MDSHFNALLECFAIFTTSLKSHSQIRISLNYFILFSNIAFLSVLLCYMCSSAMFSDADKYEVSFKGQRTIAEKLIMISSTMFLDYLFFEGETNCKVQCFPCPPSCWCKLCQLYCFGCTCPVYLKCCYQEVAENANPALSKM